MSLINSAFSDASARFRKSSVATIASALVKPDGRDGSVQVQQDVEMWVARLAARERRELRLRPGRKAWVHVARGSAAVNGAALREGEGAVVSGEEMLTVLGEGDADVLVFDLA